MAPTLNTPPCFAGFCDWRLPNRFELETLVNLGTKNPAVSAPFNTGCVPGCTVLSCSCTNSNNHWSSSTSVDVPQYAWMVDFYDGDSNTTFSSATLYVRAVRGGS